MFFAPKQDTDDELTEKEREKLEARRFNRERLRWAVVVSVITALTGLLIAISKIIEALVTGGGC